MGSMKWGNDKIHMCCTGLVNDDHAFKIIHDLDLKFPLYFQTITQDKTKNVRLFFLIITELNHCIL